MMVLVFIGATVKCLDQERMIEKEERRSVNRPRVNEIFCLQSHASGYTIFSS